MKRDVFTAGNSLKELHAPSTTQQRYMHFWHLSQVSVLFLACILVLDRMRSCTDTPALGKFARFDHSAYASCCAVRATDVAASTQECLEAKWRFLWLSVNIGWVLKAMNSIARYEDPVLLAESMTAAGLLSFPEALSCMWCPARHPHLHAYASVANDVWCSRLAQCLCCFSVMRAP